MNISSRVQSTVATILLSLSLFLCHNNRAEAQLNQRCFICRSRGPLGDCRDPFSVNSTTFDPRTNTKPSIEAVPCNSGWCAKIIENDFGDSIAATERLCMTRPPTDNEERCSETIFENHKDRKVFLCMCYGDLCNAAPSVSNSLTMMISMIIPSILMWLRQNHSNGIQVMTSDN